MIFTSPFTWVREKAMAPHSNSLAWKIPWTEEPGRLQSMGSLRVGLDWATSLSLFTSMHWTGKWQTHSSGVFCLENPRDRGAWWAAIYGVAQNRTRLKWLSRSSRTNFNTIQRKTTESSLYNEYAKMSNMQSKHMSGETRKCDSCQRKKVRWKRRTNDSDFRTGKTKKSYTVTIINMLKTINQRGQLVNR